MEEVPGASLGPPTCFSSTRHLVARIRAFRVFDQELDKLSDCNGKYIAT